MSKNFSAKDGDNAVIAGGVVNFDGSVVPAVDGSLTPISTDFTAADPVANTSGASSAIYSTPLLLRWLVKGLQAIFSRLPTALTAAGNFKISQAEAGFITFTDTQLTTPGSGTARSFAGYRRAVVNVTIANITTNVVIRIEGQTLSSGSFRSMMPRTPGNLPVDETLTANGTYSYILETPSDTLRVNFVSRGGATGTVDAEWRFSV